MDTQVHAYISRWHVHAFHSRRLVSRQSLRQQMHVLCHAVHLQLSNATFECVTCCFAHRFPSFKLSEHTSTRTALTQACQDRPPQPTKLSGNTTSLPEHLLPRMLLDPTLPQELSGRVSCMSMTRYARKLAVLASQMAENKHIPVMLSLLSVCMLPHLYWLPLAASQPLLIGPTYSTTQ